MRCTSSLKYGQFWQLDLSPGAGQLQGKHQSLRTDASITLNRSAACSKISMVSFDFMEILSDFPENEMLDSNR
jgi:hypothetical protein